MRQMRGAPLRVCEWVTGARCHTGHQMSRMVPSASSRSIAESSGTRDLYLSNTMRMHRKLRAAGVEAVLQVWEGQSHVHYIADIAVPETKEYHDEVARFF